MHRLPEDQATGRLEVLARNIAPRLKNLSEANQDLLSDLCDGKSFDELAQMHTSGDSAKLARRLEMIFSADHLNLGLPPRSAEVRNILDRAFDLMEDGAS